MTRNISSRTFFITFLAFIISIGAFTIAANSQQSEALTQIEPKYVCMMNDQQFARVQIPVEVEGKTYYGCCEMCKAKLKNSPQARVSIDPISGNQVDKAEAVIGATSDGSIYYFESEENLAKYNPN